MFWRVKKIILPPNAYSFPTYWCGCWILPWIFISILLLSAINSYVPFLSISQAEKRAHHNALERKRRDHIKESFHNLRDSIPSVQGEKVSLLFIKQCWQCSMSVLHVTEFPKGYWYWYDDTQIRPWFGLRGLIHVEMIHVFSSCQIYHLLYMACG